MQNVRTIIAVTLVMILIFFWTPITDWIGTRLGYDMTHRAVVNSTTQPTTNEATTQLSSASPTTGVAAGAGTSSSTSPAMAAGPALHVAPATQPTDTVTLGSSAEKDPTYHMSVSVAAQGAGIDQVVLNEFKREAKSSLPFVFEQPYESAVASSRPFATRGITINGVSTDLTATQWSLQSATRDTATYAVTLQGDSGPVARLHKTYQVLPVNSDPSQGYEIVFTQRFENLTDQPQTIKTTFNGPTMPPRESDRGGDRQTLAGVNNKNVNVTVLHDMIQSFSKDHASKDYIKDENGNPLLWAGSGSIYFLAIARPLTTEATKLIEKVTVAALNPEARGDEHEITMTYATTDLTVAPGASLDIPMRVFFGPK